MSNQFSADRPDELWSRLQQLVADRAVEETDVASQYESQKSEAQQQYETATAQANAQYEAGWKNLESQYKARHDAISGECQKKHSKLDKEYKRKCSDARESHKQVKAQEAQTLKESRWEATTVFEATKDGPKQRLDVFLSQLNDSRAALDALGEQAEELVTRRWQRPDQSELAPSPWPEETVGIERFNELSEQSQQQWDTLLGQKVPGMFEGGNLFILLPVFCLLVGLPTLFLVGLEEYVMSLLIGVPSGIILWGVMFFWLYRVAKRQTAEAHAALRQTLVDAGQAADRAADDAHQRCIQEEAAIAERLRRDLQKADTRFTTTIKQSRETRNATVAAAKEHYPPLLEELITKRDAELAELDAMYENRKEEVERHCREEAENRDNDHRERMEQIESSHTTAWNAMSEKWLGGMAQFQQDVVELNETRHEIFFDWRSHAPEQWTPRRDVPSAVPFGELSIDMSEMEGGIPEDPRLAVEQTQFVLPALLPFPRTSFLLSASDEGRELAAETIRASMLRMLTGIRPGKVRFTVIDPVGLGESFSAFMHLADFDEQAISSRIWTESSHIEQQLVKITEHMETVIQVYLRNEFETIQQYNDFAGEMAEPYRVLVVANFPANFSESAARRLVSIVKSGARCGVYVLLSIDTRLKMPHGFEVADLEAEMMELTWKGNRFLWKGSPLASLPLELDTPPDPKPFTDLVRAVGAQIHEIDRVEVPFDFVVPNREDWWQGNTARELDVPLGRAGAMKLQHLSMGRGTAQHVLIAGKTGSGKSNLLHAVITNVALWYGPDQVELYLVDFKKGVEFKAYAENRLPHARVVAIESEREFGLSVLERLDAELKHRGDKFRQIGVQDMAGWRRERPDEVMPRILLVIDEFQELFVEDDRIAQNAALLLDRLVRQGRAFGMHVLLGSQTLAGAYSLPRATIGQMAVRIALQCSESDAHLILSEENTAARLLTRPGEAIYNDANGLFEGNHPFQIVFLPDQDKADYLRRIRDFAAERECKTTPAIVFEGNAAANPRDNWLLEEVLSSETRLKPTEAARAWLGSAVAIKEPTAIALRRQGGSNLLMVGHDEEAALGILSTSMVSLAAQAPPANGGEGPATFYVLDGTRPDAPEAGFWPRFAEFLPQSVRLADPRGLAEAIGEVAAECTRRQEEAIDDAPPIYLVIFNLGRFRDLRREEDSFRFSALDDDKPPSPGAQLTQILREGPSLGIHAMVWCDTCNTLNRWLERQTIHDMEMRIAFQMSSGDSSMLIDSADAGKLGAHRAILYDEGLGQTEKFRPYRVPEEDWLKDIQSQLAAKAQP